MKHLGLEFTPKHPHPQISSMTQCHRETNRTFDLPVLQKEQVRFSSTSLVTICLHLSVYLNVGRKLHSGTWACLIQRYLNILTSHNNNLGAWVLCGSTSIFLISSNLSWGRELIFNLRLLIIIMSKHKHETNVKMIQSCSKNSTRWTSPSYIINPSCPSILANKRFQDQC